MSEDKNQWLPAFARDVLAGRHSSLQGTVNGKRYEILFMPENAPGNTFKIIAASPEITAQILLELSDAMKELTCEITLTPRLYVPTITDMRQAKLPPESLVPPIEDE